jgi:hypothetical protein
MKVVLRLLIASSVVSAVAFSNGARATMISAAMVQPGAVTLVANGCGVERYRGPNGACHRFGTGPFPDGYRGPYGHSFAIDHLCGAGRYRGPYGSCHKFGGGYSGPYYR